MLHLGFFTQLDDVRNSNNPLIENTGHIQMTGYHAYFLATISFYYFFARRSIKSFTTPGRKTLLFPGEL